MHKMAFDISLACLLAAASAFAASEITVDLKLDAGDFVSGERIRGVIDVANSSPERVAVGTQGAADRLFIEVFRASDLREMQRTDDRPFTAKFRVESGEGQKLETFLADHYGLREPRRYLAKPVLVHNGVRYEGAPRAFDVVEGVKVLSAMQMFSNRPGLQRVFDVVYWNRGHSEHLFLRAKDAGSSERVWETRDLGAILRIDKPTLSVLPGGEVVVLHRLNRDQFVRTEFWSLPDALEFRNREAVGDPETAGTARVREMYRESGVKPKKNPWWKFW